METLSIINPRVAIAAAMNCVTADEIIVNPNLTLKI